MESTPGPGGWPDRSSSSPIRVHARARRRRRRLRGGYLRGGYLRGSRLRRGRLRRELAAMEAALTAQTPGLAALYETFSLLHEDGHAAADPPDGAEPLPAPLWRRPKFARVATLAVLAVVVALCATLSVMLRPPTPPCLTPASARTAAAAASANGQATMVTAAQVRALECGGYPASK